MTVTAFAVGKDGMLAPTLGSAESFLVFSGMERRIVSAHGMIPDILRENRVELLFCQGIGMCLLSLLEGEGIRVMPGWSGSPDSVLFRMEAGEGPDQKEYLCSDRGRTCGSCPGRY